MVFTNRILNSMIQQNNLCRREKTKKNRRVKLLDVPPIAIPNQVPYEFNNNIPNFCVQTTFPIPNDFCLQNQQFMNISLQPYTNNAHYEEYVPMDFDIVQRGTLSSISFRNGNVIIEKHEPTENE